MAPAKLEEKGGYQTAHAISPATSHSTSEDHHREEHEGSEVHHDHGSPEDFIEDAPSLYGFHEIGVAERPALTRVNTGMSTKSSINDSAFEVDWEENDAENPRNMSVWQKSWAIFSCAFATTTMSVVLRLNITLGARQVADCNIVVSFTLLLTPLAYLE